jgi:hypothetical protein
MQFFMPPTWTWALATRSALTGWVSCGGWEGRPAVETEKAPSHENAQKTRCVPTVLHALLACGLLPVTMLFAIARCHTPTTKVCSRT